MEANHGMLDGRGKEALGVDKDLRVTTKYVVE